MVGTLIKSVSEDEIVQAFKGIGETKAPGLDGYNSKFF